MRSLNRCDAPARVLLITEDAADCSAIRRTLDDCLMDCVGSDFDLQTVSSSRDACGPLREAHFDLIILDIAAHHDLTENVESRVTRIAKLAHGALIVALSDGAAVSDAMAAMRAGAHDYMTKPVNGRAFSARIHELAERHGRPGAVRLTPQDAKIANSFHGFVGTSPQMRVVIEQIGRIAPSDAPVFITGESGTGKNLCAEALHAAGPRADKPLIALGCGTIPRDMMEAELFGVAQGAFTGATADRAGAVEQADGGTLFLDDIDALDLSLQTRLMRLLQTQTITRNGDGMARPVDVRIVAATRSNPMQLMSSRELREDLFYRLHVLPIHMPPLRQRPADILPLATYFLAQASAQTGKSFDGFSSEAMAALAAHPLPGNVRQLQNLAKRVAVLFDGGMVSVQMLGAADIESIGAMEIPVELAPEPLPILPMWRQEQTIIEDTILHFGGNISQAAAALEISPSTIYRKRQTWAEMETGQQEVA